MSDTTISNTISSKAHTHWKVEHDSNNIACYISIPLMLIINQQQQTYYRKAPFLGLTILLNR